MQKSKMPPKFSDFRTVWILNFWIPDVQMVKLTQIFTNLEIYQTQKHI